MKTRLGFVSNSSSSSFVISNTDLSVEQVKNAILNLIEAENILGNSQYTLSETMTIIKVDKDFNKLNEDSYYNCPKVEEGDILIRSISDNTIPYGISEFLEAIDATRYHHG